LYGVLGESDIAEFRFKAETKVSKMKPVLVLLIIMLNINCGWKVTALKVIPLPLIEYKGKSEFKGDVYDNTIQHFVVKNYKDCKEADSILFSYADSCKNRFTEKHRQYTAFFYKQASYTSEENISKQGKYIDRYFEEGDLIYSYRYSSFDNQSSTSKYKRGRIVGASEIIIQDVKQ